jgi:serine/threonine protein kinase
MSADEMIGRVIAGRFRISGRLGEGAMADVYRARHEGLGRDYAIKVLKSDFEGDRTIVERFRREALAASRVSHANLITIADFGHTGDGRFFLVMEFAEGRDLQQVIEEYGSQGRLMPLPRALGVLTQVADGLTAAHDAGVIHRDLKPANVLVTKGPAGEDRIKILDFGLAKIVVETELATLTEKGEIFGTPAYISPEQIIGLPVDSRCDVYAFGVMAFELLAGQLPFTADAIAMMLLAHREMAPPTITAVRPKGIESVPTEIERIVLRCLEKDRDSRPARVSEVSRTIRKVQTLGTSETVMASFASISPGIAVELWSKPKDDEEMLHKWVNAPTAAAPEGRPQRSDDGATRVSRVDLPRVERCLVGEERGRALQVARALARSMYKAGLDTGPLGKTMGELQAVDEELLEHQTDLAVLVSNIEEIQQETREREALLQHAIIDLSLERTHLLDQVNVATISTSDLDYQISELEGQLAGVYRQQAEELLSVQKRVDEKRTRIVELAHHQDRLGFQLLERVLNTRPPRDNERIMRAYDKLDELVRSSMGNVPSIS